jgi:hypothetical protein
MKNVVSFETAKRLKNAGFPQPNYEFGQVWYVTCDVATCPEMCKAMGETPKEPRPII